MSTTDTLPPETPAEAKSGGGVVLQRLVRGHLSATLYLGNALEIAPTIQGIEHVITDPPYGISYQHGGGGKGKHWRTNLKPIVGDNAPFDPAPWLEYPNVLMMGANHYAQRLPHGRWLVWDKLNGLESFDSFSDVEIAWHNNRTGGDRIYRYMWKGICQQGDKEGGKIHPSQKPTPLMAWLMDQAKVPIGATVLDPYMGSGTTGIACLRTGRSFVGIETEPEYFAAAVSRLEREMNQGALL